MFSDEFLFLRNIFFCPGNHATIDFVKNLIFPCIIFNFKAEVGFNKEPPAAFNKMEVDFHKEPATNHSLETSKLANNIFIQQVREKKIITRLILYVQEVLTYFT